MQSYMKALDAKIAYGVYSDECLSQGVYCSSVKKKGKYLNRSDLQVVR